MKLLFSTIVLLCFGISFSQLEKGVGGASVELKYDKSHISPDLRSKHCISIGFVNAQTTPDQTIVASKSWHIGYNYLILNQRKLKLSLKERRRTEMRAIGLHYTWVGPGEHYLMGTFFNPLVAKKGRFISFYFFSELGLGYHYKNVLGGGDGDRFKTHLSVEFLRLRLGRIPLYIQITGSYALGNKLAQKEPLELGYIAGLRYYFYRK